MKVIETYEEFKKYFKEANNYILRQNETDQEKTCKYFYKKYLIVVTDDNFIIELENNPTIDSTIWYDDEHEEPNLTIEYFKSYNKKNEPFRWLNEYYKEKIRLKETGGATGKYDYKNLYLTADYTTSKRAGIDCCYDHRNFIRYLTDEEENELKEIIKLIQQKYNERLERYFKRYKNKIRVSGYWVNR